MARAGVGTVCCKWQVGIYMQHAQNDKKKERIQIPETLTAGITTTPAINYLTIFILCETPLQSRQADVAEVQQGHKEVISQ